MYTIKLKDGTTLSNLELNGNNYISQEEVEQSIFSAYNLTRVEISDGEKTEVCENMTCCNFWRANDGTHIILRPLSHEEMLRAEMDAKLEYIAMMTDVEL